jgi:hypothetical protein
MRLTAMSYNLLRVFEEVSKIPKVSRFFGIRKLDFQYFYQSAVNLPG